MQIPPDALDLLEHLNARTPLSAAAERLERERYVVWLGDHRRFGFAEPIPQLTVVQRLRIPPGALAETVEEVRALLRERGRPSATWEVGPTAEPADAGERLVALGMVPDPAGHEVAGMAFTGPPPPLAPGIEVRRADGPAERAAHLRVAAEGFGHEPASDEDLLRAAEDADGSGSTAYVAYLDGEAIATASALVLPPAVVLTGAATLEHARGRGAFRALVSARIADARAHGAEVAIVQAGPMSLPILTRFGFERVLTIRVYLDAHVGG